ncbi:leucine-rich repeat domain-containing protein [Halosquirtibacter laminarini]|uniref:Leucine-rich repeat domain-containing protein n=1 Tax=Halosquirtibacter laminarini TaxID=3374600 RepID=A0AC61NGS6_9BACT|nr:leucine-rich repeat domain-containing protein [Prolixibacteraceae bacterium]
MKELELTFFWNSDKKTSGLLLIPDIVRNKKVLAIGYNILENYPYEISQLVLPKYLQKIERGAFAHHENIHGALFIPDNTENIGQLAFEGCKNITSLNISPKSKLKNIQYNAFKDCEKMACDLTIPIGVKVIEHGIFYNCKSIKSIKLHKEITKIESMAFAFCENSTGLQLDPDCKIESIEAGAFANCHNMDAIILPNSLEKIGGCAFLNTDVEQDITLPSNIYKIGYGAFIGVHSKVFTIPDEVKIFKIIDKKEVKSRIEGMYPHLFENNSNFNNDFNLDYTLPHEIKNVVIGKICYRMPDHLFDQCNQIESIVSNNTYPPSIEEHTFMMENAPNIELIVPKEVIEKYQKANYWKEFSFKKLTAVEENSFNKSAQCFVDNGILKIKSQSPIKKVEIFNILGSKIFEKSGMIQDIEIPWNSNSFVIIRCTNLNGSIKTYKCQ